MLNEPDFYLNAQQDEIHLLHCFQLKDLRLNLPKKFFPHFVQNFIGINSGDMTTHKKETG